MFGDLSQMALAEITEHGYLLKKICLLGTAAEYHCCFLLFGKDSLPGVKFASKP